MSYRPPSGGTTHLTLPLLRNGPHPLPPQVRAERELSGKFGKILLAEFVLGAAMRLGQGLLRAA